VFICDVLGHGLRAALVTAIVRGLLEQLTPVALDPCRVLSEINGGLLAIFRQTEMPMLVSAFYLVVNTVDGKMHYANAGHPRPFHVRRERGVAELLRFQVPQGPVLGIFEKATYQNSHAEASANDLVVLFTTAYSKSRWQKTIILARNGCWRRCASECTSQPGNYLAR
jgi:serine phosphatase RsbU (regulator of sigma subunit)